MRFQKPLALRMPKSDFNQCRNTLNSIRKGRHLSTMFAKDDKYYYARPAVPWKDEDGLTMPPVVIRRKDFKHVGWLVDGKVRKTHKPKKKAA